MISCVYCGGEHERPAEVKQCWADGQGDAPSGAGDQPGRDVHDASVPGFVPAREPARRAIDGSVPRVRCAVQRGPAALGRNLVVADGAEASREWSGSPRVRIDDSTIGSPGGTVETLRAQAANGNGVVIELVSEFDAIPDSIAEAPLFELGVGHGFPLDELHHLVWSNSIDARSDGHWAVVDRAVELGATVVADDAGGDIVDPDGRRLWIDGGPLRHGGQVEGAGGLEIVHAVQIEQGRFDTPRDNVTEADLADDQLAAVTHDSGPARIIAPAGSGKTRVLTERARHLLTQWRLPPSAVTLVAFNKRAQEEMRARTHDLPALHVRTLNAIALAIVNGSPPFAPQRRQWRTIDEPDVRRILGDLVQTPKRLNVDPIAPWIDALSLVRLGLVDPGEAEFRYGGDVDGLVDVWPKYRAALDRAGAVDFDDQVYRAIEILVTQPATRRIAQRACRALLVDEFQDLTPAHLLLIRLLAAPGGAVFGVGDDDQTIYGYNGADPSWLIDFDTWFPTAGAHPLEINYRCPAGVVEVADRLLRHNRRRVAKTIRAASNDQGGWSAVSGDDPVALSLAAVVQTIDQGSAPGDVAVLTRVNATIVPIQVALASAGVPIASGVGTEFVDRTAIRAALAWLRLADGSAFAADDIGEAMRRPSRKVSGRLREWASEQRDAGGLERLASRLTKEADGDKIREFVADIQRLAGAVRRGETTADVIDFLVDEIGLGGAVATLDQGRQGMNRSAQGDDLLALRQLAVLHADVTTFERWLREQLMTRRDPAGVVLSTVHRVKGQEWPHVVAHLADVDQYPHRLADDIEEERRLFHVAITRCRSHVTVVSGEHPSVFVTELVNEPPEHLPEPPAPPPTRASTASRNAREAPDHPLLDRGAVIAVPGLVLVDQGQDWVISELEPEAALAVRDGATRRFRIGAKVETAGRQRGKLGPRSGDVDEVSVRLFDELRSFRDRVRNGKPAYTVFDDKTLAGIATAQPSDLSELSQVKGVGPAKLEQYGDDVLALTASALAS